MTPGPDDPLAIPPAPPAAPAEESAFVEAAPAAEPAGESVVPEEGTPGDQNGAVPPDLLSSLEELKGTLEQKSLEMDRLQARLEHTRLQRDKLAGTRGAPAPAPKGRARELTIEPDEEFEERIAPIRRDNEALRAEVDSIRSDQVNRAIREEAESFRGQLGDVSGEEIAPVIARLREDPDYKDAIEGGDARLARSATRALLRESLAEVRLARHATAATKKAERSTNLRTAKLAATTAGAGTAATPSPAREMSQADIDKQLKSMFGRGEFDRIR